MYILWSDHRASESELTRNQIMIVVVIIGLASPTDNYNRTNNNIINSSNNSNTT